MSNARVIVLPGTVYGANFDEAGNPTTGYVQRTKAVLVEALHQLGYAVSTLEA